MTTINWKTQIYGKLQLHNVASLLYYTTAQHNPLRSKHFSRILQHFQPVGNDTGGCTSYCIVCTYLHNISAIISLKTIFPCVYKHNYFVKEVLEFTKVGSKLVATRAKVCALAT